MNLLHSIPIFVIQFGWIFCLPEQGKWDYDVTSAGRPIYLSKNVFKGAKVYIKINCETDTDEKVKLNLAILQSRCWDPTEAYDELKDLMLTSSSKISHPQNNSIKVYQSVETYSCNDHIFLKQGEVNKEEQKSEIIHPLHQFIHDGVYVLGLAVTIENSEYTIGVHIEIKNDYGYLSAVDWPLLPFYGFMCIYYIILGLIWLLLSFLQWKELLRVQFWIGGVILLGMLEKATFYAEYQSINTTGIEVQGAMLFAEWVSCAKRTLARMLVIIVSLGFGIVKPRLGPTLHRVVAVGILYFFLAASEAYLKHTKAQLESNRDLLVASVPLAVLDSAICWWIFSALVNTTRTLRLRRNEAKLSLYRHFTNTLVFSVVASVIFMLYCIKAHHYADCLTAWKDIWLEDAFWHILFSAMLLVIMILWRPTNNNQRYAFVPLLDTGGGDDEEEEHLVNDAYGVKVRVNLQKQQATTSHHRNSATMEDELRWLEENIKSDPALPVLDSDEELVSTRFEVSKMQ
ncbi:transmembrane protein 87A [Anthonomus grandis grandis]|uniref:transmembrane protein 87A n=1 Tax=Anthonomus grandis grandis TaxID=2921223 RepID=UPI002165B7A8|nr:transmembrane protein 87A [Anthonomus grandis grandis]